MERSIKESATAQARGGEGNSRQTDCRINNRGMNERDAAIPGKANEEPKVNASYVPRQNPSPPAPMTMVPTRLVTEEMPGAWRMSQPRRRRSQDRYAWICLESLLPPVLNHLPQIGRAHV